MTLLRLALPSAVALVVVSACGGDAFTDSNHSGGAGASALGGMTSNGGAGPTGGTASGGVTASGGALARGGATGKGGAISSGGSPATGGSSSTGGTTSTGGSGGQNNFDACTASSQCTLVDAGCCAACEPSRLADYVAINSARANEYALSRPCLAVLCAPCLAPKPENTMRGNYGARCVSGHCQAFDVRGSELSACDDASDCMLRVGMACCEGCSGGLAAVSKDANLQQALCGDSSGPGGPVACPACAPILPTNASAACDAAEHCAVIWGDNTL